MVEAALVKLIEGLNESLNGTDSWKDQVGLAIDIYNILEDLLDTNFTLPTGTQIKVTLGPTADVTLASVEVEKLAERGYNFTSFNDYGKISETEKSFNDDGKNDEFEASVRIPIGGIKWSNGTAPGLLIATSVVRQNESEEHEGVIGEGEHLYNLASPIVTLRLYRQNGAGYGDVPDIERMTVAISHQRTTRDPQPYFFEEEHVDLLKGKGLKWSSVGCHPQCNETESICEMTCNHATSFAVLQILGESKLSNRGKLAAFVLTTTGCVISMISLMTSLIIYFLLRSRIATEQYAIHSNLMASLLISLCIFMTLSIEGKNQLICKFRQFLLQYFFLATFCWMLCEGIHLYRKIITVFESGARHLKMYFCIGWVVPLILVLLSIIGVTLMVSKNQKQFQKKPKLCFFNHHDGSIWYFLVPILIVILINAGILVRVNIIVVKAAKLQAGRDSSPALYQAKAGLRSALLLFPLLGCSYILGFLTSIHGVFEIMYNVINSLQGFFIALFYCLMNKEIRAAIRLYLQRSQDMSTIQASTARTTVVNRPIRIFFMDSKVEPAAQPLDTFEEEYVNTPPDKPSGEPSEEFTEQPDKETTEKLALRSPEIVPDVPMEMLVEESLEGTLEERLEEPTERSCKESIEEPTKERVGKPLEQPVKNPVKELPVKHLKHKPQKKCATKRRKKFRNPEPWHI